MNSLENNENENDDITKYILNSVFPTEESLGRLVAKLYGNDYCVVNSIIFWSGNNTELINLKPRNVWYKYDLEDWGSIYHTSDKYKYEIRNKLGEEVIYLIKKAIKYHCSKLSGKYSSSYVSLMEMEGLAVERLSNKTDFKTQDLYKAISMLTNTNHRNNILLEAEARLFNDGHKWNGKCLRRT